MTVFVMNSSRIKTRVESYPTLSSDHRMASLTEYIVTFLGWDIKASAHSVLVGKDYFIGNIRAVMEINVI